MAFCATSMFFHEIIKFYSVLSNIIKNECMLLIILDGYWRKCRA
jgi:hypothetical protein